MRCTPRLASHQQELKLKGLVALTLRTSESNSADNDYSTQCMITSTLLKLLKGLLLTIILEYSICPVVIYSNIWTADNKHINSDVATVDCGIV